MLELNHVEMVDPHPCGYALYRMFMNDRKKSGEDTKKEKEHLIATGRWSKTRFASLY